MFEKVKWYLIEVGMKKYVPVGVVALFAALGSFLTAHAGDLERFGITYGIWPLQWPDGDVPSGEVILIELATLKAYILVGVPVAIAVIARALQHHTTGATTLPGGNRAGDPPKPREETPQ